MITCLMLRELHCNCKIMKNQIFVNDINQFKANLLLVTIISSEFNPVKCKGRAQP